MTGRSFQAFPATQTPAEEMRTSATRESVRIISVAAEVGAEVRELKFKREGVLTWQVLDRAVRDVNRRRPVFKRLPFQRRIVSEQMNLGFRLRFQTGKGNLRGQTIAVDSNGPPLAGRFVSPAVAGRPGAGLPDRFNLFISYKKY